MISDCIGKERNNNNTNKINKPHPAFLLRFASEVIPEILSMFYLIYFYDFCDAD